ncbi:3630_t:CDS:2, partial [Dentiscutata heterogama]
MSADLQTKFSNFLISAKESLITTTSVIYQGIKEEPWISEDELRSIVDQAVRIANNFCEDVKKPVKELSWKDPLASQVISDKSDIVKNLPRDIKKGFNANSPRDITEDFRRCDDKMKPKWTHNKTWKESEETTSRVVKEILSVLKNIWNNPAFGSEVARTLNERTYQQTVIVPLIQVALKNLPVGDSFG